MNLSESCALFLSGSGRFRLTEIDDDGVMHHAVVRVSGIGDHAGAFLRNGLGVVRVKGLEAARSEQRALIDRLGNWGTRHGGVVLNRIGHRVAPPGCTTEQHRCSAAVCKANDILCANILNQMEALHMNLYAYGEWRALCRAYQVIAQFDLRACACRCHFQPVGEYVEA